MLSEEASVTLTCEPTHDSISATGTLFPGPCLILMQLFPCMLQIQQSDKEKTIIIGKSENIDSPGIMRLLFFHEESLLRPHCNITSNFKFIYNSRTGYHIDLSQTSLCMEPTVFAQALKFLYTLKFDLRRWRDVLQVEISHATINIFILLNILQIQDPISFSQSKSETASYEAYVIDRFRFSITDFGVTLNMNDTTKRTGILKGIAFAIANVSLELDTSASSEASFTSLSVNMLDVYTPVRHRNNPPGNPTASDLQLKTSLKRNHSVTSKNHGIFR